MSLFQCGNCGCRENTALSGQGIKGTEEWYDWTGIEYRKGKILCSACAPSKFDDGHTTSMGVWHGDFERMYLPLGEFKTNDKGNLEHIKTGSTDLDNYKIDPNVPDMQAQTLISIQQG